MIQGRTFRDDSPRCTRLVRRLGVFGALFVLGCGPSPATWHLKGALWEASQQRSFDAAGVVRGARRAEAPERDFPLAPNRVPSLDLAQGDGSVSVGAVNGGFLAKGWRLPPVGPNHRATADQLKRGTWEATDEMVSIILKAADALAAVRPGIKLEIANIARRGGGRIPWSVSHQTGRDADILFPLLSEGEPYMAGAMIHLDEFGAGRSAEGRAVQLDVPGLTAVVRALAEQELVGIRHLFIARGLRQMVLDHAETEGIKKMTLRRMAQLLKQPRGALPHNDHLHVRIRCAPDDILEGCSDMGSQKKVRAIREPRVRELLRQITLQRGAQKAANLSLLKRLAPQDKRTRALLIRGLGDRSADVRRSALHGLVGAAGVDLDRELAAWIRRSPTPGDISRAIAIVEKRTDKKWTRTIRALMASPEQSLPSTIGGLRTSVGEGIWLAGVTADSRLLRQVLALGGQPAHRLDAQRAAARILIPPPTETSPEQMDILWDTFSSLEATQQAEMIQSHLVSWGLVDEEGRVDRFACYEALLEVDDAQFHAARRLLDSGHPKACRCPRWSRADLRYYWRRRL